MLFDIFYVIFGAFGNGLLWRADRRTMELVRSGHVAVGTVTDFYKTPRSRGVIYRFVNPISAEVIAARTEVYSMKLWRRTKKGQTVTVLYDPNTPERCTIYEFCGYSIVADSENCISSRA